jgi:hypothetical protein
MFNLTEIPSLARVLDKELKAAGVELTAGLVTDPFGHIFVDFSLASEDVKTLTADELFLLHLKPATEALAATIIAYADEAPISTKALKLPPKGSKVIGWRCLNGVVPVNVYIMRLSGPDRHRFLIDTWVQRWPEVEDETP